MAISVDDVRWIGQSSRQDEDFSSSCRVTGVSSLNLARCAAGARAVFSIARHHQSVTSKPSFFQGFRSFSFVNWLCGAQLFHAQQNLCATA
jgi:hypothetical protein